MGTRFAEPAAIGPTRRRGATPARATDARLVALLQGDRRARRRVASGQETVMRSATFSQLTSSSRKFLR